MSFVKRYRSASLLKKLTILFMLLVFIPSIVFGILLYRQDFNRRVAQATDQNAAALQSMATDIRIRATQVETIVERLAYQDQVLNYLKAPTVEKQIVRLVSGVSGLLLNNETYLQHLSADLVLISPRDPLAEQYNAAIRQSRFAQDGFFQDFLNSANIAAWGVPGKMIPGSLVSGGDVLPYYHKVMQGLSNTIGVVKCGVRPAELFAALDTWNESLALMVHRGGQVVFYTGIEGIILPDTPIQQPYTANNLLYVPIDLPRMDYQLIMVADYGLIHRQSLLASIPIILLGLGVGFLMMLAGRVLLGALLKRLRTTIDTIHGMKVGDAVPRLPDEGDDEVGRLVRAFNRLLRHIDQNIEELLSKEADKQQAHLMALQYQINPHFLFNSLSWMQMKVEEDGLSNDLSAAIASLGVVLHYNLSKSNQASLDQEAQHLRAYVRFMCIRKNSEIDLSIAWEDGVEEAKILRFIFQPLVENAIHHGLIVGRVLHIHVRITVSHGVMRIVVENDGKPMDERQEALVRAMLRADSRNMQSGIGLSNLVERLRLYYGERVSLTLETDEGRTAFVIQLPYEAPYQSKEEA